MSTCSPWCTSHADSEGEPLHRHVVVDDEHHSIEVWACGLEPQPAASVWLSDDDDRLEHLSAVELRRLAAALDAAAMLLEQQG